MNPWKELLEGSGTDPQEDLPIDADRLEELARLEEEIGYSFQRPALLERALTHRSYANLSSGGEKDYERFVGRLARIKTKTPLCGRRHVTGRILSVGGGVVRLDEGGREYKIPTSLIESGRLEVELSLPVPPGKARKRA